MLALLIDAAKWLLGSERPREGRSGHLWARWIFLRALGVVYFSAFYSLLFQIKGLIGPNGLLPAGDFLQAVAVALLGSRYHYAPTLLWFDSSDHALMILTWAGLIAAVAVLLNLWPRASLLVCFVCFLSFIAAAQDFSSYQSDGMLLEAGFISLFFAPPGLRPGLSRDHAASRASLFLLRWEWFRIYFESGAGKILGGDPSWRNFTAMDEYYQNGPLPTWIGWYVQHLPHWFHAFAVGFTLSIELFLVWMLFLPRRFRIICFFIVTPFEISIILTANYAFLNYIVLSLGFLLLDDRFIEWFVPQNIRRFVDPVQVSDVAPRNQQPNWWTRLQAAISALKMTVAALCLFVVFYVSTWKLVDKLEPWLRMPQSLADWIEPMHIGTWIEPMRIANVYGLFERMTPDQLEIEFQGTVDGHTWVPYKFRYKPQDLDKAPGIYAPYQPRFDWNLWFASLRSWPEYRFVVWTEERLLKQEPNVLELFAGNPFPGQQPVRVRAVIYQYWFTDMKTKRETGLWWRRELLGEYAPPLEREADGSIQMLEISTMPLHDGATQ
jgi:lipase maturation factor 1